MTETKMLTYAEALEKIEAFMVGSGIRKFCSEVCQGACCGSDCEKPCHQNEGRRINCSIFLCRPLKDYLRWSWSNPDYIIEELYVNMRRAAGRYYRRSSNPYFVVHKPKLQARCTFPAALFESLPPPAEWIEIAQRLDWLAQQEWCRKAVANRALYTGAWATEISNLGRQYEKQRAEVQHDNVVNR